MTGPEDALQGRPATLPAQRRPLPFSCDSTSADTLFTSGLDPQSRAHRLPEGVIPAKAEFHFL